MFGVMNENVNKKMEKTVKEWLNELPDGYKELAFKDVPSIYLERVVENSKEAFNVIIYCQISIVAKRFWEKVSKHYLYGTPLPTLPTDKLKIEEEKKSNVSYATSIPFEVRNAALNFATECCKMGLIGKSSDDVISFANKVVSNYFKY